MIEKLRMMVTALLSRAGLLAQALIGCEVFGGGMRTRCVKQALASTLGFRDTMMR